MRTTINIDDQLLSYAKHQAVQQGRTLKRVVEGTPVILKTGKRFSGI